MYDFENVKGSFLLLWGYTKEIKKCFLLQPSAPFIFFSNFGAWCREEVATLAVCLNRLFKEEIAGSQKQEALFKQNASHARTCSSIPLARGSKLK